MKTKYYFVITGIISVVLGSLQNLQAMTVAAVPEGAWSYSTLSTVVGGINYFPTQESDFSSASFVNYVSYEFPGSGWFVQKPSAPGGFHVFSTWALSDRDQVISFVNGGDDGHSVFIDGIFLGGAGFGVNVSGDISFTAGVPRELTVVTHNSGGEMHANFFTTPAQDRALEDTPGISISAIPEPSSLLILIFAAPILASHRMTLRRKVQ
jgi:hypothetical protein